MNAASDPSLRFLLEPGAPLVANLAALWSSDPALARRVERIEPTAQAPVVASRAGDPTLLVQPPGSERGALLHSRYDPRDEARRLVDSVDTTSAMLLFVQGLGLGYHVEALLSRADPDAIVFVFEPRPEVVRWALETRDLSDLLAGGRVQLILHADRAGLMSRLSPHMAGADLPIVRLNHPPSVALAPAEHAEFARAVDDFLAYARTCVTTLLVNGHRTSRNIVANLPWYVGTPSIQRLRGVRAGEPAIIVSAGPSLRRNKHLLRDATGRAVLIAVQTTLQPLLELGVRPDYVTALDYHEICTRFFERLPSDLDVELIAEPKATDAIFDLFPGPVSVLGNDFAESLLREMRLGKTKLRAGATVAHLAFYLAEHLGCDPILFVGQDLGFSDGLCYTPGTSYEDVWRPELGPFCTVEMKQWEQIARDRPILRRVIDHAGRPTYTEERLFTYLQQFERDFAASSARVIDATEGGVLKRGAEPMTLHDALDRFCSRPVSRLAATSHRTGFHRLPEAARCLESRRDEAESIARISNATLDLLGEIRAHLADQPRVNRAIARIDALRREIDQLGETYNLVTQLTQQTQMRRFKTDREIASDASIDPAERQRRQVMRDIENVTGVRDAAIDLSGMLLDAIGRMNRHLGQAAVREAA